jgi:predicted phage baseplate assembly protein
VVWQEVSDFYASGPNDNHFVLDHTTGGGRVGNGEHGRFPVANPANATANIVAREYRYGGRKQGNTGANTITELQTSVDSVQSVTNLQAATGGADEETVDDAKLRAPQALKSKDRAVTADDFEYLAMATPGTRLLRAKALPLTHPQFPGVPIPGVVTVIVVPEGDAPNPLPNEATLRTVCAHLNEHRLLTTEVYVVPPTYRKVKIEADLIVRPDFDLADVKRRLTDALTHYFSPLIGGESGTGWEFGGDIYFSEVSRVLLQTPGVARIQDNQLVVWLDDERQLFCRDVPISPGELVYSDGHDLRVSYQRRA